MVQPRIFRRQNHAFDAARTEAAGHDDAVQTGEQLFAGFLGNRFGIDPFDVYARVQRIARVPQRLRHGKIRIVQLHIFAHQTDGHALVLVPHAIHHGAPFGQIGHGRIDVQRAAHDAGKVRFLQHQRRFVQNRQRQIFDDAVRRDIAEIGNLAEDAFIGDFFIGAQHDDVRRNAHALQFLHGMLGGLGFMLARSLQIRHERYMNVQRIILANLASHLADGVDEGLAFDIADGSADFGDHHVGVGLFAYGIDKALDFIRDMGNDLHGGAQIAALPFAGDDVGIHLTGGQIGVLVQILIDEAFVMSQIQIGFCAVLGHVYLAVLIGAHRTGIDVDIGIQLLRRDLQPTRLEQPAQRSRRNALAQTGNHAAGYENILFAVLAHVSYLPEK